ncbi:MAG: FAD:protein FMN transferase [Rhodobacterales bacterium]|nr:FAD:protein FMN transferase [Rhodobacterales bacterium]
MSFDRDNMGLTLNGIAQGYIADKITQLFKSNGVQNVLVNTGEISALGHAPDGADWKVTLGTADGQALTLRNAAVATSAPLGTTFDNAHTTGHIIDPRTGQTGGVWSQVSVVSKSAAVADGLSTAFCLMDKAEIGKAKGENTVYLR